jgi:hypothetical protein
MARDRTTLVAGSASHNNRSVVADGHGRNPPSMLSTRRLASLKTRFSFFSCDTKLLREYGNPDVADS